MIDQVVMLRYGMHVVHWWSMVGDCSQCDSAGDYGRLSIDSCQPDRAWAGSMWSGVGVAQYLEVDMFCGRGQRPLLPGGGIPRPCLAGEMLDCIGWCNILQDFTYKTCVLYIRNPRDEIVTQATFNAV